MMVKPIVIALLSTITERLIHGLDDLEIKELQHCWDWPEYWETSWRLEETCFHSNSNGKLSANTGMHSAQKTKLKPEKFMEHESELK